MIMNSVVYNAVAARNQVACNSDEDATVQAVLKVIQEAGADLGNAMGKLYGLNSPRAKKLLEVMKKAARVFDELHYV